MRTAAGLAKEFWKKDFFLAAAILIAAAALFAQSAGFTFLPLDDRIYVTQNPLVSGGLSLQAAKDALAAPYANYYIPLTWLSLMADWSAGGGDPFPFHLTNIALHALNSLLLFAFLKKATGSAGKSFIAALLWAVHPMRVESVAWISARKDLLSAFFLFLALNAYLRHSLYGAKKWLWASFCLVAAGMLAKPVLVAAPFFFLALDIWPLERSKTTPPKTLLAEKIPLFALSAIFGALTLATQATALHPAPLAQRLSDVGSSFVNYLAKSFLPLGLLFEARKVADENAIALLYGFIALGALLAATILLFKGKRRCAHLKAGWLWFVAGLFPVSGLVAVGMVKTADHFTYLPHALFIAALVWLADEALHWRKKAALAVAAALFFAALTAGYLPKWSSGTALAEYMVRTKDSAHGRILLANAYSAEGRLEEALIETQRAVDLAPDHDSHYAAGLILAQLGRWEEAVARYDAALAIAPSSAEALKAKGEALMEAGRLAEAEKPLLAGYSLDPKGSEAPRRLGVIYAMEGRFGEAEDFFRKALLAEPKNTDNLLNLAFCLLQAGKEEEAAEIAERLLEIDPKSAEGLRLLAAIREKAKR